MDELFRLELPIKDCEDMSIMDYFGNECYGGKSLDTFLARV